MSLTVALYARVSTTVQDNLNQMLRLEETARQRGYTVYAKYEDKASGKNAHRPKLDAMLLDAKAHKFDKIMALRLDRLGRSVVNLYDLMANLNAWGVGVELLDQPIDTSTSMGRFVLTTLSAVAEMERELIRDRTLDGLKKAKKLGHVGGRPACVLSDYQIKKAKELIAHNPEITQRELSSHFDGVGRTALIATLRDLGLYDGRKTGGHRVYKETSEKSNGRKTKVIRPEDFNCHEVKYSTACDSCIFFDECVRSV